MAKPNIKEFGKAIFVIVERIYEKE